MCTGAINYKDLGRSIQESHIQTVTIPKLIVIINSIRSQYIEQHPNDTLSLRMLSFRSRNVV